ncbi:hypothetical protein J5J83_19765 [Azoarcus sp. L1K30]|uniref:hypothetical protein n=1 Tax=Azoarcus sp. L1K30 TaxID=2820277 RepID=UPI001B845DEF|nr:hypothetical protein [Azoarcus sp. L1K30]MBR0568365.1 hypothetical protein [Azoarcus sp. L1K30]
MEVIATKPGYHGKLRAVGDRFDVPPGSKATWFSPAETGGKQPAKRAAKSAQEAGDESGGNAAGDLV